MAAHNIEMYSVSSVRWQSDGKTSKSKENKNLYSSILKSKEWLTEMLMFDYRETIFAYFMQKSSNVDCFL